MLTTALSALALGGLSSLHCVGMCGPLLLALPSRSLLYHAGRIATYSVIGGVFGLLGRRIYVAGWQQSLSITLGILILLTFLIRRYTLMNRQTPMTLLTQPLLRRMTRLWQSPSTGTFFVLGMANGLLPCGMVYLALAAALTRTTATEAALFMMFFGLGTLPLLAATQYFGSRVAPRWRAQFRRTLPIATIAIALLLILRGLNLGIPFVSPHLATAPTRTISCH
jgi:sulfite exporter TauE/SafE